MPEETAFVNPYKRAHTAAFHNGSHSIGVKDNEILILLEAGYGVNWNTVPIPLWTESSDVVPYRFPALSKIMTPRGWAPSPLSRKVCSTL
jgi:hypothetical protein